MRSESDLASPPGILAIQQRMQDFEQVSDDPLLAIPAGTVGDELASIDGCWGAVASPAHTDSLHEDIEFYQFDLQENRIRYEVLQKVTDTSTAGTLVGTWEYALEAVLPDRITLRLIAVTIDSTLLPLGPVSVPISVDDREQFDLLITIAGDKFKFGEGEGASADFSGPHRANLVFDRFECP